MSRNNDMIYCNRCGRIICRMEQQERTSFLTVRKNWGYFSDNKDGKLYIVDICEPCCDRLAEEFVIAPEIEENIELI